MILTLSQVMDLFNGTDNFKTCFCNKTYFYHIENLDTNEPEWIITYHDEFYSEDNTSFAVPNPLFKEVYPCVYYMRNSNTDTINFVINGIGTVIEEISDLYYINTTLVDIEEVNAFFISNFDYIV